MQWLVVGLGNPGKRYDDTPHNVGFAVVDRVAEALGASEWKLVKAINSLVCGTESVTLIKPQTFMNNSGDAIKSIATPKFASDSTLVIIYDDLSLPLGKLRIGENTSSGGHRGVESIIERLGRTDFIRVRVGVLPPSGQPSAAEEYVTAKWQLRTDERQLVEPAIQRAAEAATALLTQPLEAVQNMFN